MERREDEAELLWRYIVDIKYADGAEAKMLGARAAVDAVEIDGLAPLSNAVLRVVTEDSTQGKARARARLEAAMAADRARQPQNRAGRAAARPSLVPRTKQSFMVLALTILGVVAAASWYHALTSELQCPFDTDPPSKVRSIKPIGAAVPPPKGATCATPSTIAPISPASISVESRAGRLKRPGEKR